MMDQTQQTVKIQIPREYKPLFETWWRNLLIHGGRFSLKSHTTARALLIRGRQRKLRIGCFREFQNSIADSSLQLLADLIEKYEFTDYVVQKDGIYNKLTGTEFLFKGLHRNMQNIKSLEGVDIAWVEEAQTISRESIQILVPTIRKPGSQIIWTFNRLEDLDPVWDEFASKPRSDTLVLHLNYDVAEKYGWLPDVIKNQIEYDKLHKPEVFKHIWLGEPSAKEGRIYNTWKKLPKVPDDALFLGTGGDFGYTNDPTAIINIYKWNNAYIVHEVAYEYGMKNRAIANAIRVDRGLEPVERDGSFEGTTREISVFDSQEPKSIDEIAGYGVAIIGAMKGPGSVDFGIQLLQDLEIYYTGTSTNIEYETRNYKWKLDKNGKSLNVPADGFDHAMDAIRYKISDIESAKQVEWGGVR